jgi:hypothetical protein
VCTVLPASIDTPLWQRSANHSGRRIKPLDPVHPPEQVATVILGLARAPQREAFAGATGWVLAAQHAADPELSEAIAGAYARSSLFQDAPAAPTAGAVFEPAVGNGTVDAGWMAADRPGVPAMPFELMAMIAGPGLMAVLPSLHALHRRATTSFR